MADHRRHGAAEEGGALGRRGAAIRFFAWEDSQLSVSGLGDAGIARSAGGGGAAALSARDLGERSRAHDASPGAEGSADRSHKAGNRDRRDRPCHRLRRALRLCACRFRIRIKWAFPPGFERARPAMGSGLSRRQNVYPADVDLVFPVAKTGKRRKYHIPDRPPLSAEATLAGEKWREVNWRRGTKGPL